MSRRLTLRDSQQRGALAVRLRQLVNQLEALADRHCETLHFEIYIGLSEQAAELKGALRVLLSMDIDAALARLVHEAELHIAFILEEQGGTND